MKLKKAILTGVTAAMMLATATCFAQIYKDDLNIGGIYYKQPWSEVINRFGQPIKKEEVPPKGYMYTFQNGNSTFKVKPYGTQSVLSVSVDKDGILKTKAGIGIGSSLSDIKAAYGEPDIEGMWYGSRSLIYHTPLEGRIRGCLSFRLDKNDRFVEYFSFIEEYLEGPLDEISKPKQKPRPQHQQKSSQSTIPTYVTEIPKSELNIGGINPGQDINYVEQVYGKPTKIDDEGFFQTYNYNDKFIVKAKLNKGYKVTSVASYEKGLKMPGGVMVGMNYADVVKKFGKVNGAKFKGTGVEAQFKACTEYIYYSGDQQAVFIVDKKGIVQGIRVEDYDEQKFIEAKRKK